MSPKFKWYWAVSPADDYCQGLPNYAAAAIADGWADGTRDDDQSRIQRLAGASTNSSAAMETPITRAIKRKPIHAGGDVPKRKNVYSLNHHSSGM